MSEYLVQSSQSLGISIPNVASACTEQDDAELVTASQAGSQEAFAQLVQRHQRRVFNLVFRMLQQYEEANEVTQETFFAAWQGLHSFRGDSRFSTWLYRIAYNCSLKQLEQRKRDKALQTAMQEERAIRDHGTRTELEVRDCQNLVREQLSLLPAKYRIVLVLRHLQEMTYEEMAEILTMPIGTIKTHLFRARNLLKERLEAFEQEWKTRG
ncbi:sigma-70 family RNA polymerase sigma factor [Ktedonosporobacter rubrisoli]|uniref:Sigma-70 family RNA polymerase sigma factor n=1 Tax=Ktedonosporobacter rubrisoli TaxID=2509675 RepID=A0A4P6JUZ0_KTERU|nr:sigma-70 family RNA polymerase sigma factor [Ktedonosporobacter rubrisoli]QBD79478.1 sigma-70 family RNA polymerase sigma factor [Ktedonosporobacter rubrisoli]